MAALDREQAHRALAAINANLELAGCDLLAHFPAIEAIPAIDDRAEALRAVLLRAIEVLRPPRRLPFGAPASRSYDVLTLRYVGSRSIGEIADELSLSPRQIHRDLAEAEEQLARVLTESLTAQAGAPEAVSPLDSELSLLATQSARVLLEHAVRGAIEIVTPLLSQRHVRALWQPPAGPATLVEADLAFLRQVLAQLLSWAAQTAARPEVFVSLELDPAWAAVAIAFVQAAGTDPARFRDVQRMAAAHGMECCLDADAVGATRLSLRVPRLRPLSILVIEDNPSAVELYRRYLPQGEWEVHALADSRAALETVRSLRPDVIVLDIMLPRVDGWTVLGTLAASPESAAIPVIVCSVVDDPGLAMALGARDCLKKPVSQAALLRALGQLPHARRPRR